jgi:hypothetical protein
MNDSWLERAVLIYGPNKSGTTLLQSLLDGGDRMLVYPGELKLKAMQAQARESARDRRTGFLRYGRGDFKHWLQVGDGSEAAPLASASKPRTFGNLTAQDMLGLIDQEAYLALLSELDDGEPSDAEILANDTRALRAALVNDANHYCCWAAKEVGGRPDVISEYFLSMFPRGRIVYVTREPRAVVRSIIRDRRRRMGQELPLREIARRCRNTQRFLDYYARAIQSPNSILVRYEDLVRDTERELRRVTDFLELPFEEIHTKPTILGRSVVVVTSSRDTREVFDTTQVPWSQGLTLRERLAIRAGFWASR